MHNLIYKTHSQFNLQNKCIFFFKCAKRNLNDAQKLLHEVLKLGAESELHVLLGNFCGKL